MRDLTILVGSWSDGLFALSPDGLSHEFQGRRVAGLASDGWSGAMAVLDGTALIRHSSHDGWKEVATSELRMECCLAVDGTVYAGTEGAHLLRFGGSEVQRVGGSEVRGVEGGEVQRVEGFDAIAGRTDWFAGSAIIDGEVVGPPLSVRSLAGTRDGRTLLAGVHVGGIARSVDGGHTWQPTIEVAWDVHEVCVHPDDPETVIAACAVGLCISLDGGSTWVLEPVDADGTYCSAVAFVGSDLLVSVSDGHFAPQGAVMRRAIDSPGTLEIAGHGLPDRLAGIVDTRCIASKGSCVAVVDGGGNVYASDDGGRSWTHVGEGIVDPSSALIL
ncbi:MAG: hypothetical protein HKN72_02505 [Gemmatimonadetes bacterium]|nr:hypothetical protein [Gemmatimonadota bacterium]